MSNLVDSVLKKNSLMPLKVRQLDMTKFNTLRQRCADFNEIIAIFGSVNHISHTYRDKDGYVLKRIYEMSQDQNAYREEGFSNESRIHLPSYAGKPW